MSSGSQDDQDGTQSWRSGGHLARMTHCLDSGFMADCTFLLTDREGDKVRIPALRALLSLASPVLEAMLSETWRAQEKREIRIEGVTAECFRLLLGYVYTGQTPDLDMDSALELLAAAHMYLVSDLLDACVKHITASLSAEKVCQVLEVASTLSLDGLHSIVVQYLVENTSAVLRAESFPECSAATLRLILEQDSLSLVHELELVRACILWGRHQAQSTSPRSVRAALGDLVFLLRLRGLTTEELTRHVVPRGLLTKDEQIALFCCVSTRGESAMPRGFTDKIRTLHKRLAAKRKSSLLEQVGCTGAKELLEACTNNDRQTVRYMLEAGVPVDARVGYRTFTPLIAAAFKGHTRLARLLLDHGADLEVTSMVWLKQATPLHFAACYGHTEVVKLLLERGSEVNVTDLGGNTPLHFAISKGHTEIVGALLEAGADPKTTDGNGNTPLLLASLKGRSNREMIETIKRYL